MVLGSSPVAVTSPSDFTFLLRPTENDISTAFGNLSLISNSENTTITEYEPKIITAIKEIRNKKKRPDIDAIFDYISRSEAPNIDIKTIDSFIQNFLKKNVIANKKTPQGHNSFYILAQTPIKQNENEQNQLFTKDNKFENFMVTLKQNENSPNQNNIKTNNAHTLDTTATNVDFEIDESIKATPMLVNTNTPTQTKGLNESGSKDVPIVIGSQITPARNKDVIIDLEPSDEAILTQDHNNKIRKAQKEYFKVTSNKETYTEFHEENYKRPHLENDTKPEAKLSAIKSYVKCEITGIIDKVNTFTEKFDEKMRLFDNMAKTLDMFQQNISFLQNQLISKDELIKSLMDTQTAILETLSKNKQKNVSDEKPVNEHDDSDDDEHNNEFQHQQEQIKNQDMQNVDNTLTPTLSKEFLDIQATIECGFTLKRVRDMTRTYSQMHRTDKYSEHSSIVWPVWPNG